MTNPSIPPSYEGARYLADECIIAEDWETRFTADLAGVNALRAEIDSTDDPNRLLYLTEMKGAALARSIGSGILSRHARDIMAKRENFKAEFGDR